MHRAKELTPLNLLTVFPHLSTSLMYDCGMGKWQQLGPRVYSIDVSSHRRLFNTTIAPRGLRLVRALARWLRCLRVVQGRDCCGAEAVAWVWTKTNSSLRGRVACVYEIPGSWDYTTRVCVTIMSNKLLDINKQEGIVLPIILFVSSHVSPILQETQAKSNIWLLDSIPPSRFSLGILYER